jgi:hypothetical protein
VDAAGGEVDTSSRGYASSGERPELGTGEGGKTSAGGDWSVCFFLADAGLGTELRLRALLPQIFLNCTGRAFCKGWELVWRARVVDREVDQSFLVVWDLSVR